MAVKGINYDIVHGEVKYESVRLHYNYANDKKIFNTGNFPQDWYDCLKFVIFELDEPVSNSSDVNHFIMDGAPYDSAYLVDLGDDKWELVYEYTGKGIEFFVEEGTKPTWKEMKEMYGAKEPAS